jgi:hypothetical protein
MGFDPYWLQKLQKNDPHVVVVHLSCANIDDSDVQQLCLALMDNSHVHSLILNWNRLTDVGAAFIAALLRKNKHLERVEFAGNPDISEHCIQALQTEFACRFSGQNGLRRWAINPHRGVQHVEEVFSLTSEEFLSEFYQAQRPVIIRGGAKDSFVSKMWTPEYFRETFGKTEATLSVWTACSSGLPELKHHTMLIDEIISLFEEPRIIHSLSQRLYIQKIALNTFPELKNQLKRPDFSQAIDFSHFTPHLWFGQNDTHTPLHFDEFDNLFFQMHGQKSMTLFSPLDTPFLFQHPPSKMTGLMHVHRSIVPNTDILCDEFLAMYENATPYHAYLRESDVLFIPKRWWHEVRSLASTSISVNYWFPENPIRLPEVDALFSDAWRTFSLEEKKLAITEALPWLLHYNQPNYVSEKMTFTLLQLAVRFDVHDVVKKLIVHPLLEKEQWPCYCSPQLLARVFDRQDILKTLDQYLTQE